MDTEEKTAGVKSKGIRNQADNTREVPAYEEYSDMKGLTGKKGRNNRFQNFRSMLGCQTSGEKQQLSSNFTEEFGLS